MTLDALAPGEAAETVAELDELGYPALWVPEAWGREAFTSASLYLGATRRMTVATGIASIWGRDAVASANAARTLNAASQGRFLLGLGVSHRPLVERLRGHDYQSPLSAMAAYLAAMDAAPMVAAEKDEPVARVIAALGPKMLALGASAANGVHTYLVTPEHTARARATIGTAFLAVEQAVVVGEDRDEFLSRAHAYLEFYTGLDNYRANWRRLGFADEDFVRGGSTRLADALVAHVTDDVAAAAGEHLSAGADHVCLQFLGPGGGRDSDPRAIWRRVAPSINATPDNPA
ncbi:MAG: TIGR03620 family F420-dependent LLM class oxidoreductase [Acidobacteriota bacterium]|nr:TIGR03620 family F420-dependent LLM class oxidoreductase [Acidobacteriota bacterium]